MPLRPLMPIERERIRRLAAESIEVTLIQPTATGLRKSIIDATAPVRNYLAAKGLHDYTTQLQGASKHGVRITATLLGVNYAINSRASLYRPQTKSGDPRIWFRGLPRYARPDDMLALFGHAKTLAVVNLTRVDVGHVLDDRQHGPLWDVLCDAAQQARSISDELLGKLRSIAAPGPLPSVMDMRADTAVGRTLEAALGIPMNSLKQPDYKGIELKAYRSRPRSQENRKQLFSKVPNWKISKFSSMTDVLDAFGYFRDGKDRLNCTVSAANVNSQGLTFAVDDKSGILNEVSMHTNHGAFASWYLSDLRKTLAAKHAETFWVRADVQHVGGREHFDLVDAIHTRGPLLSQFDTLVEQGEITMDHMMKRMDSGKAHERGPSFKIRSASLELLFPPAQTYALTS